MSEEPEVTEQNEPADVGPQNGEASPAEAPTSEEIAEPAAPEEVAEVGREFLTGLLQAMGLEVQIESSIEGQGVSLEVAGEELGVLIGRRGQTLDALQELTRTAVQRRLRSRVRLMVDVEGYRARRRDSLADYARSIAERAKDRGTEIELEPMSSWDRKIVHDAVADVEGVTSFSEGVDPNRKVVIRAE